ncbi:MAG TPA: hypothetical protein VFX59_16155 [Polyangiales bacterium]|nr:hypothetical protein [Polyangiales bacterium]
MNKIAFALGMLGLGFTTGALASPPPGGAPREGGGPREPPPFAFEACNGKAEGDDCSVQFHDETKEGRCLAFSDARLFCMPNDMPSRPAE